MTSTKVGKLFRLYQLDRQSQLDCKGLTLEADEVKCVEYTPNDRDRGRDWLRRIEASDLLAAMVENLKSYPECFPQPFSLGLHHMRNSFSDILSVDDFPQSTFSPDRPGES